MTTFSLAKVFTFLFLTLGPLKVLGPFWRMTRGRDRAFKRRLALRGTGYATGAVIVAALVGVTVLQSWGISAGALQLAAGLLLFLVALQEVMRQYAPRPGLVALEGAGATPPSVSDLAFSLAFPMIVTPYGVALVITLLAIRPDKLPHIVGSTALVVGLNLLAMLTPDRALKTSFVSTGLAMLGVVMSVLMMALGIQVGIEALRLMALG
jgi:multiple antibiotic resistance protein